MIKQKIKICRKCKKECYYWTVGLCKNCSPKYKYIYKRKATSEKKLFGLIWKSKEHRCENCKIKITTPRPHNFSHIIPKSRNNKLRLDPTNIQLLCFACHYAYDFQGKEKFEKRFVLGIGLEPIK